MSAAVLWFQVYLDSGNFYSQPQSLNTDNALSNIGTDLQLSTLCPSTWFANFWDSATKCGYNQTCSVSCSTTACCGNNSVATNLGLPAEPQGSCNVHCNAVNTTGAGCQNLTYCTGSGRCNCAGGSTPVNCSYYANFNCYLPNTFPNSMSGVPNPTLTFKQFDTNTGQPNYVWYTATYPIAQITTPQQVQTLVNFFGSKTQNCPSTYATQNDSTLQLLLEQVCATSTQNFNQGVCASYCGVGATTTGTLSQTSIATGANNCPVAYASYCNSPNTFTNNTCMTWYSASAGNTGLSAGTPAYTVLTTQCDNDAFFTPPTDPNGTYPEGVYTISPSAPPVCGCFYPPQVPEAYYTALNNAYPGIVATQSAEIQCNFPPCSNVQSAQQLLLGSNTCPSSNLTSCVNYLTLENSNVSGGVNQTNACTLTVTDTTTTNNTVIAETPPPASTDIQPVITNASNASSQQASTDQTMNDSFWIKQPLWVWITVLLAFSGLGLSGLLLAKKKRTQPQQA